MRPSFRGIVLSHADCRRTKKEESASRVEFGLRDPNGPPVWETCAAEDRTPRDVRERRGMAWLAVDAVASRIL